MGISAHLNLVRARAATRDHGRLGGLHSNDLHSAERQGTQEASFPEASLLAKASKTYRACTAAQKTKRHLNIAR